ncbi:uncharacterized protein PGTG_03531 [Puccinia graminis f. sp. tritici CRL 75-36-700-3]|uniref:Uncharacterized protein n=1 Tax=Puccinia graminis f. sp. tritici (strain CRL 75-36-700-3 / race SCCL) TaxID=418459 RepID=E3JZV0_PUCGT|nr:uncharacterized protein PGTG_03531 [Puccinia graminis f. sp. tritici CRL 75-36-700-3]EFP77575.2 hypothetical protein PGTG_03531 [Puccinia graminis f. sp. tritici CRL 75-36-700-3]
MVFSCLTVNPNQPHPLKCIRQTGSNSIEAMPLSMQCIPLADPATLTNSQCTETDIHKYREHQASIQLRVAMKLGAVKTATQAQNGFRPGPDELDNLLIRLQYSVGSDKGKVLLSRPLIKVRRKPIGEKSQECPT